MTLYNVTCDFCGDSVASTDELIILPVDRFEIPGVISNMGWAWGACPECKPLLEACVAADSIEDVKAAIEALAKNSLTKHNERDGAQRSDEVERQILNEFCIVYAGLLRHQNDFLRPWDPTIDETGEES